MDVLAFWVVALATGAFALPIAFVLLRRFPDGGAAVAMPLGLVLTGCAYFLLRFLDALPAGRGGYVLVFLALALVGLLVAKRDTKFRSCTVRRTAPALIAVSGLFTLLFFGYVAFRSYNAEIVHTEQPMDFMYLNATLTSPDYPPQDPWLAGETASYYYFGYLQIGFLTSVADVPASTGYNLGLAYTFAAAGVAVASLAAALVRWVLGPGGRRWGIAAGGIAIVLLLLVGSISATFEWAAAHGNTNANLYHAFGVEWLLNCEPGQTENCWAGEGDRSVHWYPDRFWFWWDHTRLVTNTIVEAPFFSFLLGDLHPHVMAIPLTLLVVALAAAAYRGRGPVSWRTLAHSPLIALTLSVILGALAFANAWDLPTFTLVLAAALMARNLRAVSLFAALRGVATYLAPIVVVAIALYLPWYLEFSSPAGWLQPYEGKGTIPAHALQLFGPVGICGLLAGLWAATRVGWQEVGRAAIIAAWVPVIPFVGWIVLSAGLGDLGTSVDGRTGSGWVTLAIYGLSAWMLFAAFGALARFGHPAAFASGLAGVAALLLFGSELFYIPDVYEEITPRLNTVFKLSYQAWTLLAVAGAVGLTLVLRPGRARHPALLAPVGMAIVLIGLGLAYPITATPNRTEGFERETAVDGLDFLARNDPAEYALTRWMGANLHGGETIIEASGRSWGVGQGGLEIINPRSDYTDGGRLSARTGLPTPIGWIGHEVQWRGNDLEWNAELQARQDLVDRVYLAGDPQASMDAIAGLEAGYVVVGRIEQQRYPAEHMTRFEEFLEVAYEGEDGLRVYRVPEPGVMQPS